MDTETRDGRTAHKQPRKYLGHVHLRGPVNGVPPGAVDRGVGAQQGRGVGDVNAHGLPVLRELAVAHPGRREHLWQWNRGFGGIIIP